MEKENITFLMAAYMMASGKIKHLMAKEELRNKMVASLKVNLRKVSLMEKVLINLHLRLMKVII